MIGKVFKKVLGSKFDRDRKKLQPLVDRINRLEEEYQRLSDDELRGKTEEFRSRIAERTGKIKRRLEKIQGRLTEDIPEEEEEGLLGNIDQGSA